MEATIVKDECNELHNIAFSRHTCARIDLFPAMAMAMLAWRERKNELTSNWFHCAASASENNEKRLPNANRLRARAAIMRARLGVDMNVIKSREMKRSWKNGITDRDRSQSNDVAKMATSAHARDSQDSWR